MSGKDDPTHKSLHVIHRWLGIAALIVAGEMIFGLPFHIARYYRPTLLTVLDITNAQLGDAFAIYGVMALLAYFPSGIFADRFQARTLMSVSLFATGCGGFYLATLPNHLGLSIVFGFWGLSTILLFWSAMLKATREWGGLLSQGKAFGLLDGGRGLLGAVAATLGVFVLSFYLPDMESVATPSDRVQGLKAVIYYYSFLTLAAAVFVRFAVPDTPINNRGSNEFSRIAEVFKRPTSWLQALIVVCAYCGYRGLDYYGLYGVDHLGLSEVGSARMVSNLTYLRPLAAILAGITADVLTGKRVIALSFALLTGSYVLLTLLTPEGSVRYLVMGNLLVTYLATYALRGVYFALFEETNVNVNITGTTVGFISLIGFTPDIFFNSLVGRILDTHPGMEGYHRFFFMIGCFALCGLIATIILVYHRKSLRLE